ncbi:hypothetical protein [Granulosicoccus antarcticus]|uniref:Uncharacterized protein n=1 Tax=Granulosicoccus antarcticus IMCC3135 TaxID=1192854 RepID=A0A2Z2NM08_9GAMM|nr:hypothetical protein [Granulosicoccus antarcticus]ASJ72366.1 hypothetical protein IMCC3135_11380 [Granulosicoccus antarcticus IMCC3135]
MQFLIRQRMLTSAVVALQLFMQVMLVMPSSSWAQTLDTDPPRIDFKPVVEGLKGDSQVFSATVSDDQEVSAVMLHYRLDNESVYQNRTMSPIGSTGIFSTTLKVDKTVEVIQYYIEATDKAGNRTLQGFAFDPIERKLLDRQVPAAQTTDVVPEPGMSTGRKILYGVLGLVVVGAIASAAGGSDSGGSSAPDVPVTITVSPLP